MADHGSQWTIILVLTALLLSLVVVGQIVAHYGSAYLAAPREITAFIDTADFSIQENESYDRDVAKVQRLEDKMRLGRLLREIQKSGDDLREDLNSMLVDESGTTLRMSARLLWAAKRRHLEDRVRRLDQLRMRFLVVYLGLIADKSREAAGSAGDPEKMQYNREIAARPGLPKSLADAITRKPPTRRLTTQAIGHSDSVEGDFRTGWAGVIRELQRSPKVHKRHASIEQAMTRTESPEPMGSAC